MALHKAEKAEIIKKIRAERRYRFPRVQVAAHHAHQPVDRPLRKPQAGSPFPPWIAQARRPTSRRLLKYLKTTDEARYKRLIKALGLRH